MHFEILVEDASGSILLESVIQKILGPNGGPHTRRIFRYKGIGHLPKGLKPGSDSNRRILLDQLPRLLRGYGRSLQNQDAAVVVVVDQDRRDCHELKAELLAVLESCNPRPTTLFRIAIEEVEAWLLGDRNALLQRYPAAKQHVLDGYTQDTMCDTWELLADVIYPGGAKALKLKGWPVIGQAKCEWAREIGASMDIERNTSRSFQVFCEGIRRIAGVAE